MPRHDEVRSHNVLRAVGYIYECAVRADNDESGAWFWHSRVNSNVWKLILIASAAGTRLKKSTAWEPAQLLWTRAEARCTGRGGTAGTMAPGGEKQHEPYYANADLAAAYLEAAFTTLKDETMTTKDPTTPAVVRPAAGANATALDTAAPARSFFDWGRASAFAIAAVSTAD